MNDDDAIRKRLQAINDAYLEYEDRDLDSERLLQAFVRGFNSYVRPTPRQAIREEVSRDQAILNGDLSKLWEE